MYYVDTSILAAYYCPEALSTKAETFLTSHLETSISLLTEVELYSALSRKIREGNLNRDAAARICDLFVSHRDASFYRRLEVASHHYVLARNWLGRFNTSLKSLDAIHLAIASSESLILVTADDGLSKSAEILGVETIFLAVD